MAIFCPPNIKVFDIISLETQRNQNVETHLDVVTAANRCDSCTRDSIKHVCVCVHLALHSPAISTLSQPRAKLRYFQITDNKYHDRVFRNIVKHQPEGAHVKTITLRFTLCGTSQINSLQNAMCDKYNR